MDGIFGISSRNLGGTMWLILTNGMWLEVGYLWVKVIKFWWLILHVLTTSPLFFPQSTQVDEIMKRPWSHWMAEL